MTDTLRTVSLPTEADGFADPFAALLQTLAYAQARLAGPIAASLVNDDGGPEIAGGRCPVCGGELLIPNNAPTFCRDCGVEPPDADACHDCRGISDLATVIDGEDAKLCGRCATKRGFRECGKCARLTPPDELVEVQTLRQTFESPAEYDEWCLRCAGGEERERDWDDERNLRDGF